MSNHRRVFAEHFKSHIRKSFHSSEFEDGKWLQGACERYAEKFGFDLALVVAVVNAEREPTSEIMDEFGVQEAWITEKEEVSKDVKIYRWRNGDRLY
jgi:hypothetical protein